MILPYSDPVLRRLLMADPMMAARWEYEQRVAVPPITVLTMPAPPAPMPYTPPRPPVDLHHEEGRAWDPKVRQQEWRPWGVFVDAGGATLHVQRIALSVRTQEATRGVLDMNIMAASDVVLPDAVRHAPVREVLLRDGDNAALTCNRCWRPGIDGAIITRYRWPDLDPFHPFFVAGEQLVVPLLGDGAGVRQWRRLALVLHERAGGMPSWRALHAI